VTRSLENVSKEFNKNNRKNKILSNEVKNAVWENQQLWIALKSDLIMEGNALPDETKAALISLSIWIDKQSWNVIKGEGEITPLIDVNKRIIAGLQGQAV
jgi:flagellar biosynthesis activator protein FlaF